SSPHVRGLGTQQRAAAVLVGAVITMLVATPSVPQATAAPAHEQVGRTGTVATAPVTSDAVGRHAGAGTTARSTTDEAPGATYTAQPGDSRWRDAEQALRVGARIKQIADLNYGVVQADGGALDAGNWIEPGWVLQLPADARVTPTEADEPVGIAPSKSGSASEGDDTEGAVDVRRNRTEQAAEVVVERGDTLWGIAEEELGDGTRYPEVYEASRDTVQPDGRQLTDPDLIYPGWTVTVPGAQQGAGSDEGAEGPGAEGADAGPGADGADAGPGADGADAGSDAEGAGDGADAAGPDGGPDAATPGDEAGAHTSAPAEPGAEAQGQAQTDDQAQTDEQAQGTALGRAFAGRPDFAKPGVDAATGAAGGKDAGEQAEEESSGGTETDRTPSTEVTPEGAVEVEPDDITEGGDAPQKEAPADERPAGEAPASERPNRAGQNAGERASGDESDSARRDAPDPADVGTGAAGLGGRDAEQDPAPEKEPAPERTADGVLVPEAPPAPEPTEEPQYERVTPEDLENEPDLDRTSRDDAARTAIPFENLIADDLLPQDEPEEPTRTTDSGAGTTWGGPASGGARGGDVPTGGGGNDAVDDGLVGTGADRLPELPAPLVPEPGATTTSGTAGGLLPRGAGDGPVVGDDVPELAVESAAPGAGLGPVDVAGATTAAPESAAESGTSLLDAVGGAMSDAADELEETVDVRTAAGVGGLLAAGLLALVAVKRRRARKSREPGETLVVPGPETPAGALERELHAVEDPF